MTNHDYARLLLAQPEMLIYRYAEDSEYPFHVIDPIIEEDRDPALLIEHYNKCMKEISHKCDALGIHYGEYPNHPSLMEIRRKYGKMKRTLPYISYVVI